MSSNGGDQSSDSNSNTSDELSSIGSFFFYVFLVHPITAWILRPGRFERKKSILYAILFLSGLALLKTGLELQQRGPNYYTLFNVTRASTPLEIKRAYKKLSLILHPDKNPSPNAASEFDHIKQAYDVLMDMELREVYNKFGHTGIKQNKRYSETQFLLEVGIYYVTYGIMAFMITLGEKKSSARNWIYTGLLCMLVVEVVIMSSTPNPIPIWFLPQFTEYEFIWLFHSLFPAFMNGCRSIAGYLYVDIEEQTRQLLLALHEQNKDILLVLRDVQINVQTIQLHGGGGGGGNSIHSTAHARVVTDENTPPGVVSSTSGLTHRGVHIGATPTGKLKELQTRLQSSNTHVAAAVNQLQSSDKGGNSNMGFYLMILGYIVVSYLFG